MSSGRGGPRGRGRGGGAPTHLPAAQGGGQSSLAEIAEVNLAAEQSGEAQTGTAGWSVAKQRKWQERQAKYKQWEAERRAKFPHLYAAGHTDEQVRRMVATLDVPRNKPDQSGRGGRGRGGAVRGGQADRGTGPHTRGGSGRGGYHSEIGLGLAVLGGRTSGATPKRKRDGMTSGVTPPAKKPSTKESTSGGGAPYAQAAKEREHFPHMLAVYKGITEQCPISAEDFTAVAMRLRKRLLAYAKEENRIMLETAFIRWGKFAGRIACLNAETAEWYRMAVSEIVIGGTAFRAWNERELATLHPARINVSGLEGADKPEEIMELIQAFTPGLKGKMSVDRLMGMGKDAVLILKIDDEMAQSLANQAKPWVVNMGSDKRTVQYSGKQALKERDLADQLGNVNMTTSPISSPARDQNVS